VSDAANGPHVEEAQALADWLTSPETQVKAAFQAWADHVSVLIGQPAQASNVIPMPARA